jgi:alanyl-tRNA synthetase
MTDRLYYNNPYLAEFDATIDRVLDVDGRTLVVLDRTAFYPTSGGQPFDTGTLASHRVVEVIDRDDGTIAHAIATNEGPGAKAVGVEPGRPVHGTIDWPRRFDHMQQHTGQHVLSAAFERLYGVRTVSFHLGSAASTIDLARTVTANELEAAETYANRIVWEDRPVTIRYADARDAAALPLRKESAREGTLRLIEVEDCDLSACGGTHVARTGAIGVIAVASSERFKGGQRLEFLCGGRALARFRSLRDTVAAGVRLLSVSSGDLPAAIERLQADAAEQRRSLSALQNELMRYRAEDLAANAEVIEISQLCTAGAEKVAATADSLTSLRLVATAMDADATALKSLAMAIAARPGHIAVLVSTGAPSLLAVARSSDVPMVRADEVVKAVVARFGGRGGGKAELAQGGGFNAPADEILTASRSVVTGPSGRHR